MRRRRERLVAALLGLLVLAGAACSGPRAAAVPLGAAIDAQSVLVALPAAPAQQVGLPRPDPVPAQPPAPPADPTALAARSTDPGPAAAPSPAAVRTVGGRSPPPSALS